MPKQDSIFQRLVSGGRVQGNHSDLVRWMILNHDKFAEVLALIARPGWNSIADELTKEGLTRKDGQPLTSEYVRVSWWKARRAFGQHAKAPGTVQTPKPSPAAPLPTVTQVPAKAAEYPGPRRPITFASPKTYPQEPK